MFDRKELDFAIDMQQRSYRLLKWIAAAVSSGMIRFNTAHTFTSFPDAASSWLSKHFENVPPDARPNCEDVLTFANFFCTYLENSFDFDPAPGKRLYSPGAHCFCPLCSWLIDAPNLTAKKLTSADKKRANRMRGNAIQNVAVEFDLTVADSVIEKLLNDSAIYENASLVAYGFDLFHRMKGTANGPAVLALWRGFAWDRHGSPRPKFRLTSKLIMNAEAEIVRVLKQRDDLSGL